MQATLISIGDEILIGQIVNTNATYIAQQLNGIGISVNQIQSIPDSREAILNALAESAKVSDFVIITGGLGPTSDDITKPALCEYFDTKLRFDEKAFEMVEAFLKLRGSQMNPLNRLQAEVPEAATVLYNPIGTAPGLWFKKENVVYVAMPGVPFEMEEMMQNEVLPRLKNKYGVASIYHKTVLTTGISESKLALDIEKWEKQLPNGVKLAYLPSPGMVKLRLSAFNLSNAEKIVQNEIAKLQTILGNAIWGFDNDTMEIVTGRLLKEAGKKLATAESCTGGNISRLITSISGSSEYFIGGIVAYSNEIKIKHLGVSPEIIEKYGAVSQQTVEAMAKGAKEVFNADYAIAVSGIAGPTGGTPDKPVGTVWIAVASPDNVISQKYLLGEHRQRNIDRASIMALQLLRLSLLKAV